MEMGANDYDDSQIRASKNAIIYKDFEIFRDATTNGRVSSQEYNVLVDSRGSTDAKIGEEPHYCLSARKEDEEPSKANDSFSS